MNISKPARESDCAIIRLAGVADSEALARLSGQLGYPADGEAIKKRLDGQQQKPDNAMFVTELEQNVIGWLHVFLRQPLESELMAEIGGLVVDERNRGAGIGKLLMARAEQWARDHCCGVVSLRTNVTRTDTHRFYEKLGYRNVKTQHTYRKRL